MTKIKLYGVLPNGDIAKTHQADKVCAFTNEKRTVTLVKHDGIYLMNTRKNTYNLSKHLSQNYYHCTANNIKVHFIPKKVVAQLIYWE